MSSTFKLVWNIYNIPAQANVKSCKFYIFKILSNNPTPSCFGARRFVTARNRGLNNTCSTDNYGLGCVQWIRRQGSDAASAPGYTQIKKYAKRNVSVADGCDPNLLCQEKHSYITYGVIDLMRQTYIWTFGQNISSNQKFKVLKPYFIPRL